VTEFTREDMQGIVERSFPADEQSRALELLDSYGAAQHEREPARVRIAALKLAGGRLSELEYLINHARQDYRDIIAWASLRGHNI
jgi:hypothetical protein